MTTAWRSRIVREYEVAPDQLLGHPLNARRHPASQRDALDASLDTLGWIQRIVVNARTGHVIDGHARAEQAISRGEATVPVIEVDLSEEEERLALAVFDPISAMATYDQETLAELLEGVSVDSEALAEMLAGLKAPEPKEGNTDPDDVPEEPETPYVQRGDVYVLGEHRVMCGDATSAEDVGRLLDGATAGAVVTDPPYGISVVKHGMVGADFGTAKKGRYAPVTGDGAVPAIGYLLDLAVRVVVWGGNYFADQLPPSGSWLVWDKRGESGIENTFADCELAWSNVGGPARVHRQLWNGMIREGEHDKREHPTQKPVALMEWCLAKTTGAALDPFLGSGTTLIAAERQSRRCYGMEIEPKYVQVAIERWEAYTGQKAVKVDG